jgi:hypothetical protein
MSTPRRDERPTYGSTALAIVLALIGLVPVVTAILTRAGPRAPDSGMAWGVFNSMIVAPAWLAFAIAAVIVDLRPPRTRKAMLAAVGFPVGFVIGMFVLG